MHHNSNKLPLLILGIASLVCSRAAFLFVDDPEGPNLLIVVVLAIMIFAASLAIHWLVSLLLNAFNRR